MRRVTKVVKGGKQLSFRAVVVVGDGNGTVGVGCDSAKEVAQAVRKAVTNAKRNLITVPLTKNQTFPHRFEAEFKAAKVGGRRGAGRQATGAAGGGRKAGGRGSGDGWAGTRRAHCACRRALRLWAGGCIAWPHRCSSAAHSAVQESAPDQLWTG